MVLDKTPTDGSARNAQCTYIQIFNTLLEFKLLGCSLDELTTVTTVDDGNIVEGNCRELCSGNFRS